MKCTRTMIATILAGLGFFFSALACAAEPATGHSLQLVKSSRTLVMDDFLKPELPNRRLTRGEWRVADGIAACTQDEELFKKYNNHGPAIWYDQSFQDAVIRFELQPSQDCSQFVFTVNGEEGHVFRFVMNGSGTDVRAWSADHKPKQVAKNGPPMVPNVWTPVTVELVGSRACVHIGDKYQVAVDDASYLSPKTVVGVSFHHGALKLRNFELSEVAIK